MGAATIERDPPNTGITDVVELHGAAASNMAIMAFWKDGIQSNRSLPLPRSILL
jgi:hypothetical protein